MSHKSPDEEFSYKKYFVPLTTAKAIIWIIFLGLIVYANSLFNGFVWDDSFQIVTNAAVQSGNFSYYFSHTIGPYYRPLMFVFYTAIYQTFGLNSFFFHFNQILFHILNTLLIFWLFRFFSKRTLLSFVSAVLFLIHPLNTESVNYLANLQDILFVFFGLAALYVSTNKLFQRYSFFLTPLLLFLSTLAKETGILFFIMYILYLFVLKKKDTVKLSLVAIVTGLFYLLLRFILVGPINPTNFNFVQSNTMQALTLPERMLSLPKIIQFYLFTFFYPADLTAQYWYVKTVGLSTFFLPLLFDLFFFGGLLFIGIFINQRYKQIRNAYWFFFIWFLLGLGFHLQILPLDKTIADRWFYFPMIGLLGMLLLAVQLLKFKNDAKISKVALVLFLIVILTFATRDINRNANWHDDITLFSHDLPSMENVADIQDNYGMALVANNHPELAIQHLQKADQLLPNNYLILYDLGTAYLKDKKPQKAAFIFEKVIKLKKDYQLAYRRLIIALLIQNNYKESEKFAQIALSIWPNDPYFLELYGLSAYKLNDYETAIKYLQTSLEISPNPALEQDVQLIQQHKTIYFTLDN